MVFWYTLLSSRRRFLLAALLHDIGKPFVATLKLDGYDYSFTNHEEKSYQMIKRIPFISNYTKKLVRYHYLRRRIIKDSKKLKEGRRASNGDPVTQESINKMIDIYNSLPRKFQRDLRMFQKLDDKAK